LHNGAKLLLRIAIDSLYQISIVLASASHSGHGNKVAIDSEPNIFFAAAAVVVSNMQIFVLLIGVKDCTAGDLRWLNKC
jgi:hypothetical protein